MCRYCQRSRRAPGSSPVLGAVRQANPSQNLLNARSKRCAAQAVQMALMPEVFIRGELLINTLRLEDDADLATHGGWFLGDVGAQDQRSSGRGDHQG